MKQVIKAISGMIIGVVLFVMIVMFVTPTGLVLWKWFFTLTV